MGYAEGNVDAVEWVELVVLLVLVLFMAGVYRLLWEYTKAIRRQNIAINAQDNRLHEHRQALEVYEEDVARNLEFLNQEHGRLLGRIEDNATHLEDIRDAVGYLVPALDRIRTVLKADHPETVLSHDPSTPDEIFDPTRGQ